MIVKLRKPHTVAIAVGHGKQESEMELDLPGQTTYVAEKDGGDYVVSAEVMGLNKRFALRMRVPASNVEVVSK